MNLHLRVRQHGGNRRRAHRWMKEHFDPKVSSEIRKAQRELDNVTTRPRHAREHDAPIKNKSHAGGFYCFMCPATCHLCPSASSARVRIATAATPLAATMAIWLRDDGGMTTAAWSALRTSMVSPAAALVRTTRRTICLLSIDSKRREA